MSALCAAFVACNDESQREDVPFTVYSFGEGSPARWANLDYDENYGGKIFVINSDEEMKKYVEGDYPAIDFAGKTLLLACGSMPNSSIEPIIKYFKESSAQNYRLCIDVITGDATFIGYWQVAILTDKFSEGSKIELSVKII